MRTLAHVLEGRLLMQKGDTALALVFFNFCH